MNWRDSKPLTPEATTIWRDGSVLRESARGTELRRAVPPLDGHDYPLCPVKAPAPAGLNLADMEGVL